MKGKVKGFAVVYVLVFSLCILTAVLGSRAATVMSEAALLEDRHCIVIDAGHGGEDGGATSCTGVLESAINLQIALRLNDLLRLLGYDTAMIRTTDVSVHTQGDTIAARKASDLKQRVRIVNETNNAILVSIHQNLFLESKYSGAQVFYAPNVQSAVLAKQLQNAIIDSVNRGSNRQAKQSSGIYLLENIETTGILVECGFLSNPVEERKLREEAYQKKLCGVIATVLCDYLDQEGRD